MLPFSGVDTNIIIYSTTKYGCSSPRKIPAYPLVDPYNIFNKSSLLSFVWHIFQSFLGSNGCTFFPLLQAPEIHLASKAQVLMFQSTNTLQFWKLGKTGADVIVMIWSFSPSAISSS